MNREAPPGWSLPKRRARESFPFLCHREEKCGIEGCRGDVKGEGQRGWTRCTEEMLQEWSTWAVDKTELQGVEGIRGRVELGLCANANGRKKMALTGGAEAAATQSAGMT